MVYFNFKKWERKFIFSLKMLNLRFSAFLNAIAPRKNMTPQPTQKRR